MNRRYFLICVGLSILVLQCNKEHAGQDRLFELLPPQYTGVDFQNVITPNDTLNLLNFEYMYNGGGVGIGDFDKDGLPDLIFTGNSVESKLYLNQGALQFKDITSQTGINTKGKWCTGVSVIDINADGYDDIYLCVGGPEQKSIYPNLLFINQGDLTFKEAAAAYGLADPNESNQAVFFDYDLDGDLDMYLLNGGGFEKSAVTVRPILTNGRSRNADKLYRNDYDESAGHPVYTNVSIESGVTYEGFGLGVGIIDANQDFWPDIYVSNDYLSRDLLYINQQDGSFEERALDYFGHMSHFTMGNGIADINNDGYFDIVSLDMLPERYERRKRMFGPNKYDKFYQAVNYGYGFQYMRNMLHLSNGANRFMEVGQLAGIDRTDWSWAPLIADFDHDGFQDIYITNGYGKDITDLDFVNFRKDAIASFTNPDEAKKVLIKSLDEVPAIRLPNYSYKNKGDNTFKKSTDEWGLAIPSISNGAVYADLDQDGDLEIITNNIDQPAFIFRNNKVERDSLIGSHFLKVRLNNNTSNGDGLGATVVLHTAEGVQYRYQQPTRGFQSSGSKEIHFGLAGQEEVDSLVVIWPDQKRSILYQVAADQSITVQRDTTRTARHDWYTAQHTLLKKVDPFSYTHEESSSATDFKVQPLLLHGFTHQGPGMAVGDLNNDGLDDLFIGGAYGTAAQLIFQHADGSFTEKKLPTEPYEDLGALFFDADNDKDLDIYVTSGGSERYDSHPDYQDRIYLNDGKGNFRLAENLLPPMLTSTASVAAADYDQDGDQDIFVGGRLTPGKFPVAPRSYLLKNTGGQFKDVTAELCNDLAEIGMVTAAIWTDFNNDQMLDLIIVGEMMPICLFKNEKGTLKNITNEAGLSQSTGMWNSIASGDFDRDGDMDYVLGNIGENTAFKASDEHPFRLHFADFDSNGSIDPIYSSYEEGDYHPWTSLDLLTQQLPEIKKRVLTYSSFAKSTTADILGLLEPSGLQTLTCEKQSSVILQNLGANQFSIQKLPLMAQVAPVKGILVEDITQDGWPDIILVGNDYQTEVVNGKYDASHGQVLINDGNMGFELLEAPASGLNTLGDTRSIVKLLTSKNNLLIFIANNSGELEHYLLSPEKSQQIISFGVEEVKAVVKFTDGSIQSIEYQIGTGYLSQQSRGILLSEAVSEIYFLNALGERTRSISISGAERKT